ncbi:MAG: mechanosensitive ion channel, partial [Lacipirellulaceae bacterium]
LVVLGLVPAALPSSHAQQGANPLRGENAAESKGEATEKAENVESPEAEEEASTPSKSTAELTVEQVTERLKLLESAGLDETKMGRATAAYQAALESLTLAEQQSEERAKLEEKLKKLPQNTKLFREQLSEPLPKQTDISPDAELESLEREALELEQLVKKTTENYTKSQSEPAERTTRLAELPELMAKVREELEELNDMLESAPSAAAADAVALAEETKLRARRQSLTASLSLMQAQQQLYSTGSEALKLKQDVTARKLAAQEKQLTKLREAIATRRQADATAQANAAAREAKKKRLPPIAELAERNVALADLRRTVLKNIDDLTAQKQEIANQKLAIKTEFTRSQERAEGTGLSEGMGQLLRKQQAMLPDLDEVKLRRSARQAVAADVVFRQYELNDQSSDLAGVDREEQVQKVVEQLPENMRTGRVGESAAAEIGELLKMEREYLDDLISDYEEYSRLLAELSVEEAELIELTENYAGFIAERVLWIRSSFPLSTTDIRPAVDAALWSLDPRHWADAARMTLKTAREHSYQVGLFVLALGILLAAQQRSRRLLSEIGKQASKSTSTDFWLTLRALWLTLVTSLPWPILLWFLGWWMDRPTDESEFVHTLSHGLRFVAVCLFLLEFVRQLCRAGGLADAHFQWPAECLTQARRNLRWLTWAGLPLVLWLVGLERQRIEPLWSSSLGRVLFIIVMLLLAFVLRRVLLASGSPLLLAMKRSDKSWLAMLHKLWGPVLVLLPVFLAVLATMGYYYTAQHMAVRLLESVALVFALLVIGGVTRRWILTTRRKLAMETARKRREQQAAAADANATPPKELAEEVVDLKALGAQTNKLVQTVVLALGVIAAWFIWEEMLSAVAFITEKPILFAEGGTTWGQLLGFGLIIAVTWGAVRDLPALLDFAVLQHLPMDGGSRYAFMAICRYVMLAIGVFVAFGALGFHWDSIQWLVAAMGVGLGFGLQEIFANFISGIILLFERPIRVGDIITLGDRTGVVNRIRMRSTTIVDWDRKEYVVPNKDLITERLLNWTLSDHTNRIVVEVGVAYGSDTELACQLLKEAALEHPLVLDDPAPIVVFDRFGDSALILVLRCYLPDLEKRLDTIHELNTAIDKKYREAGLEIAFPQTDLHLRTVPKAFERLAGREVPVAAGNGVSNGQGG